MCTPQFMQQMQQAMAQLGTNWGTNGLQPVPPPFGGRIGLPPPDTVVGGTPLPAATRQANGMAFDPGIYARQPALSPTNADVVLPTPQPGFASRMPLEVPMRLVDPASRSQMQFDDEPAVRAWSGTIPP
jgi:hypothetical protein